MIGGLAQLGARDFDVGAEHGLLLVSAWVAAIAALVVIFLGWRLQLLLLRNMRTLESQRMLLIELGRKPGEESLLERLAEEPEPEVREFMRSLRDVERAQSEALRTLERMSRRRPT